MTEIHDAVVVGAGWAGVSVSFCLKQAGIGHVVLERDRVCETWRMQRWDSFRMNTPNIMTVLPGDRYAGDDPEGYMTRDAFIEMVEGYVELNDLPVHSGVEVQGVRRAGSGFEIRSSSGPIRAEHVVVATGNLNVPRRPKLAKRLPASLHQIDGARYRRPSDLPPGAILVVGCGNTGGQIAEELLRAGRTVYLSTGRNGRVPRTYRGRDIFLWLTETGRMARPRTTRSGRGLIGATHTISLQSLSAQGAILLGRLRECSAEGVLSFDDTLADSAAFGDEMSKALRREIDDHIERNGLTAGDVLADPAETVAPRYPDPPIRNLDLSASGITTVLWSVGLGGDFSWLDVPGALDEAGEPVQDRGLSVPGLYFAGLDTLASLRAGTVLAAAEDATRIVDGILGARQRQRGPPSE